MSDIFALLKKITPSQAPLTGPVTHIVAGLGNIGSRYDKTRHNVGFEAVDHMAEALGFRVDRVKFKANCGEAMVGQNRVLFLKPGTFMNLSGQSVSEAAAFYKIPPQNIIVIADDIALAPGRLRVRLKGSDGGHNGLKNIILLLASDQFVRIKIGVGQKPHPDFDLADWVLGRPEGADRTAIDTAMKNVQQAVTLLVAGNAAEAMNRFNTKQDA